MIDTQRKDHLRFLLTSAAITNERIRAALVELLGKPIAEASAVCIPTAIHALPGGPNDAWLLVRASSMRAGERTGCWSSPPCPRC